MQEFISLFLPTALPRFSLTSLGFCSFFAISIFFYYSIPKKIQWGFLLFASLAFFVFSCEPWTIFYLIGASFVSYSAAILGENFPKRRNIFCSVGIFLVLLILAVLKYSNFLVINWNYAVKIFHKIFHLDFARQNYFQFLAPIGISFYTLMLTGYLLDYSTGKIEVQKNFFKFLLFASYFPQLTSGPISRYEQISNQIYEKHDFDYSAVSEGIVRMAWGFF